MQCGSFVKLEGVMKRREGLPEVAPNLEESDSRPNDEKCFPGVSVRAVPANLRFGSYSLADLLL